jgi:hypothetical protein
LAVPAETLDKPGKTPLEVIVEGLEEECGLGYHQSVKYNRKKLFRQMGTITERVYHI